MVILMMGMMIMRKTMMMVMMKTIMMLLLLVTYHHFYPSNSLGKNCSQNASYLHTGRVQQRAKCGQNTCKMSITPRQKLHTVQITCAFAITHVPEEKMIFG